MERITVIWHGTETEAFALEIAITNNCDCQYDERGNRKSRCVPHRALIEDQRWVDGLLWVRHQRDDLWKAEFSDRGRHGDHG